MSFVEAALGAKGDIPTPEGSTTIKVPPGTQSGSTLRVKGQGMPFPKGGGQRGDLFAVIQVLTPRIQDERSNNNDWNTIWYTRSRILDDGWSMDFAVPYSSLRTRGEGPQVWGFNLRRVIGGRRSTSPSPPSPRRPRCGPCTSSTSRPRSWASRPPPRAGPWT